MISGISVAILERSGGGGSGGKGFFRGMEVVVDSAGFAGCEADGPDPKGVFSSLDSSELSLLSSLDSLS